MPQTFDCEQQQKFRKVSTDHNWHEIQWLILDGYL